MQSKELVWQVLAGRPDPYSAFRVFCLLCILESSG